MIIFNILLHNNYKNAKHREIFFNVCLQKKIKNEIIIISQTIILNIKQISLQSMDLLCNHNFTHDRYLNTIMEHEPNSNRKRGNDRWTNQSSNRY